MEQDQVYKLAADSYHQLISAEDCDGHVQRAVVTELADAAIVADIGAGTGRVAGWVLPQVDSVILLEREPAMLDVAKVALADYGDKARYEVADAVSLPLPDDSVDAAVAGWAFGHFMVWAPDDWLDGVATSLAEMRRIVRPGGTLIVIETMGTATNGPTEYPVLQPYYEHLRTLGFEQQVVSSDYLFDSVAQAVSLTGEFFGQEMAEKLKESEGSRVPEWTAVFVHR